MDERTARRAGAAAVKPGVAPRLAAARALGRVLRTGAYSNVVVRVEGNHLPEGDRRRMQRLLFGTLRRLIPIDAALSAISSRPLDEVEPAALDVLRIAAFDLDDTPRHAVVDSSVEAVRRLVGERAVGFVNAVLRALPGAPTGSSYPGWMAQRLSAALGSAPGAAFMTASDQPAAVGVWAPDGLPEEVSGRAVQGIENAYLVDDLEGRDLEGRDLVVIDPASVAVVQALDVVAGLRVADLAAAPGGKTALLADGLSRSGTLVAMDRNERRVARARHRLGSGPARWLVGDAVMPPLLRGFFDRVLLDAPCTGLGSLRRRPEIRHRLDPEAPGRMGELQRSMVEAALELVAPGGRLVYSVCTVFPEETIEVVAGLGSRAPDLPGVVWGGGRLLGPHLGPTDGMFIAEINRG